MTCQVKNIFKPINFQYQYHVSIHDTGIKYQYHICLQLIMLQSYKFKS